MQNETRVLLSLCQPNPELLRSVDRDSEDYQEFASSIKARGVLQPILVRPIPDDKCRPGGPEFFIIEGLQRWSASNDAGFTDIPVRVVNMTDKEVRASQIVANAHRVETKPKEYAEALQRMLRDDPMLTRAELAGQLNKSPAWLDQRLSLTRLNDVAGELVDTNKITLQNAITLSKLAPEDQEQFVQDAMTKDAGVFGTQVQAHLKEVRDAKKAGRPTGPVEYVPGPALMKVAEIEAFVADGNTISAFLKSEGIKTNSDTVQAATMAIKRVLNLNPLRIAERKAEFESDKIAREAQNKLRKEQKDAQKGLDANATRQRLEEQLAGV